MSAYLRGQRGQGGKYWISFTDHQGIRRRMPALTDRRQSEALERQIESLAAARVGGDSATPEQERFIAGLPKAMVKKLVRWDILPGAKLEAARPLAQHVADYIAGLKAKGRDEVYCDNSARFLIRMAMECGWKNVSDITPDSIVKWRDALQQILQIRKASSNGQTMDDRKPKAASAKTKNIYLSTAKAFCNWLVQHDRIGRNPLANVGGVEERGKQVRVRRALSDDEIIRLLDIAGKYRNVYLTALTTGLRRREMSALTWGDVHLAAAKPFINVRASIAKNHKTATMFLREDVVVGLRAIAGADTDHVFDMPGRKRFKSHLKAAGIEGKDRAGRIIDFHSLRHTFITSLSKAGVSPRVAMELARHSQIDLTMRVYTDAGMLGTADAVNCLPSWQSRRADASSQTVSATGTDPLPLGAGPESAKTKRDAKRDAEGRQSHILPDLAGQSDVSDHPTQGRENPELMRVLAASSESGRQDSNLRPLSPEPSALAKLSYAPLISSILSEIFDFFHSAGI